MVLGVISAKIKITSVSPAVAMAIPASPHNLIAITVAIAEASILTKLLPIRMTLINACFCARKEARKDYKQA
jgi:hypothetical protein